MTKRGFFHWFTAAWCGGACVIGGAAIARDWLGMPDWVGIIITVVAASAVSDNIYDDGIEAGRRQAR
jgi:uncharacterized membrane protein YkvI